MKSYLVAIGAIVGLMTVWGLVQMLWLKCFPEYRSDVDALALRKECHNCDDKGSCGVNGHSDHKSSFEV